MGVELRRRAAGYEAARAKGLACAETDADAALYWFCVAAAVAWLHHFDRWVDAEMDEAIERVAARLVPEVPRVEPDAGALAHLTSTTLDGGGHVEVLLFWCEQVGGAVVSSEWYDPELSRHKSLIAPSVPVHRCPRSLRPAGRARWMYERLAELRPRRVVLHANPNDAVALAAALLYRRASGAELILNDHADNFYWLGASLVDRLVEFRPAGAAIARLRRGVAPQNISLVPLTSRSRRSPEVTREALGVPAGATLSLTVAAFYKARPDGHWDYARTLSRVLAAHPNHHHLVVGHGAPADEAALREGLRSERVRWLGKRTDVDALLRAADFVVESFPMMGGAFRLDAMREGRAVVAITHPAWPFVYDTGAFPEGYPFVAGSNEEVERFCAALIADAALRAGTGAGLRRRYEERFSHDAVARALREALAGRPFAYEPPPLAYDPERASRLLGPAPLNALAVERMVAADLGYAPARGLRGRVSYLAGYAREALRHRLSRLRRGPARGDGR